MIRIKIDKGLTIDDEKKQGALLPKIHPIVKCKILNVWDMNETIRAVTACY